LAAQVSLQRAPLEAGDRSSRIERQRAVLLARLVRVTRVTTAVSGHRREALRVAGVALVVDQGPGAVERGRAEIVGVPAHRIARRVADAAIDALDAGIRRAARRAVRRNRL